MLGKNSSPDPNLAAHDLFKKAQQVASLSPNQGSLAFPSPPTTPSFAERDWNEQELKKKWVALKQNLDARHGIQQPSFEVSITGIPPFQAKSRVETQIKMILELTRNNEKLNEYKYISVMDHLYAKEKKPKEATVSGDSYLTLDAFVVGFSGDGQHSIKACPSCIQRERRRAMKRLSKTQESDSMSDANRESFSFQDTTPILVNEKHLLLSHGDTLLPSRIICYCRHHGEKIGFCVYIKLYDDQGNIGTALSPPIMMTDDHKKPGARSYAQQRKETIIKQEPDVPKEKRRRSDIPDSCSHLQTPMMDSVLSQSIFDPLFGPCAIPNATLQSNPIVTKAIPSEGPMHGGIEVTILGCDFYDGLMVMFGDTPSLSTTFWSENTLICILPPSAVPGSVLISLVGHSQAKAETSNVFFVYKHDAERSLLELALQVINLRMTGQFDDAQQIAMRIVSETKTPCTMNHSDSPILLQSTLVTSLQTLSNQGSVQVALKHPQTRHTLLHFAAMLNYCDLALILLKLDQTLLDCQDRNGCTALYLAVLFQHNKMIELLVQAGAHIDMENYSGTSPLELAFEMGYDQEFIDWMVNSNMGSCIQATRPPSIQTTTSLSPARKFRNAVRQGLAQFPPLPQLPPLPQFPHMPWPQMPQLPQFPQFPQFPQMPQLPQLPQFPHMPWPQFAPGFPYFYNHMQNVAVLNAAALPPADAMPVASEKEQQEGSGIQQVLVEQNDQMTFLDIIILIFHTIRPSRSGSRVCECGHCYYCTAMNKLSRRKQRLAAESALELPHDPYYFMYWFPIIAGIAILGCLHYLMNMWEVPALLARIMNFVDLRSFFATARAGGAGGQVGVVFL